MATTSTHVSFVAAKAEAFAGRFLTALNDGALCLMASIGHRTGLFDVLRELPPSTSEELAAKAGLHERYVREWLGAMVAAGVVEVDPATSHFSLPPEHAASLTRAAADNIAMYAQYIALLGSVEDAVVECFKNGGGVPYEKYTRFHDLMAESSGKSVLASLETRVLPLVPGLTERLTHGLNVLDAGCGQGLVILRLAKTYPDSKFLGIDLSSEAIEFARGAAASDRLENVAFVVSDLSNYDVTAEPEAFDFITTFDAIHDQAKPLNVLKGLNRALKADGIYLMQEVKGSSHIHNNTRHPLGTLLYTFSCMHCMTVSLAQGGEGLGAMWGEEKAREYLRRAGFNSVEKHELPRDIQSDWYVVRK